LRGATSLLSGIPADSLNRAKQNISELFGVKPQDKRNILTQKIHDLQGLASNKMGGVSNRNFAEILSDVEKSGDIDLTKVLKVLDDEISAVESSATNDSMRSYVNSLKDIKKEYITSFSEKGYRPLYEHNLRISMNKNDAIYRTPKVLDDSIQIPLAPTDKYTKKLIDIVEEDVPSDITKLDPKVAYRLRRDFDNQAGFNDNPDNIKGMFRRLRRAANDQLKDSKNTMQGSLDRANEGIKLKKTLETFGMVRKEADRIDFEKNPLRRYLAPHSNMSEDEFVKGFGSAFDLNYKPQKQSESVFSSYKPTDDLDTKARKALSEDEAIQALRGLDEAAAKVNTLPQAPDVSTEVAARKARAFDEWIKGESGYGGEQNMNIVRKLMGGGFVGAGAYGLGSLAGIDSTYPALGIAGLGTLMLPFGNKEFIKRSMKAQKGFGEAALSRPATSSLRAYLGTDNHDLQKTPVFGNK